ncbi:MAG: extracellular solute-binding protein [Rhizobiales bacterium]|nr:extracellular solute-binding protein [Hyphomicrobiales bacterium]
MSIRKPSRRDVLYGTAATGAGLVLAGSGLPVLAQDGDQPLPEGSAGKLTVIHRTEYFEAAQNLFRETVGNFARAKNAELDISTTNPESFGDFLGKMTAAVRAGHPPDLAYTSTVSIPQMQLLGLVEDVSDVVDEAISRYGALMTGINAEEFGMVDGKWASIPFIASTVGYFFRADKLKEKGIDPATLDTFDSVATRRWPFPIQTTGCGAGA